MGVQLLCDWRYTGYENKFCEKNGFVNKIEFSNKILAVRLSFAVSDDPSETLRYH